MTRTPFLPQSARVSFDVPLFSVYSNTGIDSDLEPPPSVRSKGASSCGGRTSRGIAIVADDGHVVGYVPDSVAVEAAAHSPIYHAAAQILTCDRAQKRVEARVHLLLPTVAAAEALSAATSCDRYVRGPPVVSLGPHP